MHSADAPEGAAEARILIIRDHWKNVGMGFMPEHVASVMRFAVQAHTHEPHWTTHGRCGVTAFRGLHQTCCLVWYAADGGVRLL